jgi:hypothetical protein
MAERHENAHAAQAAKCSHCQQAFDSNSHRGRSAGTALIVAGRRLIERAGQRSGSAMASVRWRRVRCLVDRNRHDGARCTMPVGTGITLSRMADSEAGHAIIAENRLEADADTIARNSATRERVSARSTIQLACASSAQVRSSTRSDTTGMGAAQLSALTLLAWSPHIVSQFRITE